MWLGSKNPADFGEVSDDDLVTWAFPVAANKNRRGNVEPGEENPGRAAAGRGGGNRGPENPAAGRTTGRHNRGRSLRQLGTGFAITVDRFCDNRGQVLRQPWTFLRQRQTQRLPLSRFSDTSLREPPLTSNRVTRGEYLRYLSNTPPSEERDNRDANAGEAAQIPAPGNTPWPRPRRY